MHCSRESSAFAPDDSSNNNNASSRCQPFIIKLLAIVEDEGNRNLISWSPCGDFLRIYDCDEFARVVLPRYFRHCNWTSFVRQLNMYNFHKLNEASFDTAYWRTNSACGITASSSSACGSSNSIKSADKSVLTWEFKHESFRRDAPKNQLSQIKRKKPKDYTGLHIQYADTMRVVEPSTIDATPTPLSSTATAPTSLSTRTKAPSQELFDRLENKLFLLGSSFDGLIHKLAEMRSLVDTQNSIISTMTNYMEEIVENGSTNQKVSSCTPTTTATTTTTTTTTDARPHSASMDYNQQLQKDDKPTATTTADARPHSVSVNHVQQPQKDGVVYAELRWSIKEGSGSNNSNIPDIKRNSAPHNGDSSVEYDELSKSKRLAISEQSESSSSSSLVFTAGSSCFGESGGSKSLGDADNKKRKRRQNSSSSLSRKSSLAFILQQNQADSYP